MPSAKFNKVAVLHDNDQNIILSSKATSHKNKLTQ
jgi:hypothetical protein